MVAEGWVAEWQVAEHLGVDMVQEVQDEAAW